MIAYICGCQHRDDLPRARDKTLRDNYLRLAPYFDGTPLAIKRDRDLKEETRNAWSNTRTMRPDFGWQTSADKYVLTPCSGLGKLAFPGLDFGRNIGTGLVSCSDAKASS